jgi:hypothetical protein
VERQLAHLLNLAAEVEDRPASLLGRIREAESALATLRGQKAAWAERAELKDGFSRSARRISGGYWRRGG